jgi:RNA polymerase sigma factor for flagellar operon FliA
MTSLAETRTYGATSCAAAPTGATPPDEVITTYLPLVRRVVRRLAAGKPPHVEIDELVSWGIEGLLDACKKYDPRKKAAFTTYAQFRIRGAILDRLRHNDWVSRGTRQKASRLEKAYRHLEGKLGRPATESEAAEELGLTLAAFQTLLSEVGQMTLISLEDIGLDRAGDRIRAEAILDGDGSDPIQALLSRERVDLVAGAIRRLPEKEQAVIALYYHEGITMKEVGAVLDLTESRVSQLHAQALLRLRGLLHENFGGAEA